jgi:hypothetical protein
MHRHSREREFRNGMSHRLPPLNGLVWRFGFMSIGWFLAGADGVPTPAVPLTHPGLAGCRQHRRLLKRLIDLN